jgi:hypothetical protein
VEKETDISSLHLRLERKQSLPSTPSPNWGVMCLNPFRRQIFWYETFKIQGWIPHSCSYIKFSTHYTITYCDLNTNITAQSQL